MNVEALRETIVKRRRLFETWLTRPDFTPADRERLQRGLEQWNQLERDLDEFVRLTLDGVEEFEDPTLLDFLRRDADEGEPGFSLPSPP